MIDACFRKEARIFSAMTQVGNGDDASVHALPEGQAWVVSVDTAVAGVHWPYDFPLHRAADRAVCAALSDLAAMGATAHWVWLSVMAEKPEDLVRMGQGAVAALNRYQVELSGGDTVAAKSTALSVTVSGLLPQGSAMQRGQANIGDDIWLLGQVGHSALALQAWFAGERETTRIAAFCEIQPRLKDGVRIRDLGVRCCMDVSDGLLQDAGHMAQASSLMMVLELADIPDWQRLSHQVGEDKARQLVLSGGEDYALLFTAPPILASKLQGYAHRIGYCCAGQGVEVLLHGEPQVLQTRGYEHFAE